MSTLEHDSFHRNREEKNSAESQEKKEIWSLSVCQLISWVKSYLRKLEEETNKIKIEFTDNVRENILSEINDRLYSSLEKARKNPSLSVTIWIEWLLQLEWKYVNKLGLDAIINVLIVEFTDLWYSIEINYSPEKLESKDIWNRIQIPIKVWVPQDKCDEISLTRTRFEKIESEKFTRTIQRAKAA